MTDKVCKKCGGAGWYFYDKIHSQPCPVCCKHDKGWWDLTEHYYGYLAGADNGCCRAGCGQMRRELRTEPRDKVTGAEDAP